VQYANERNEGERFGDFVIRAEFVTATPAGNRFHEKVKLAG
jgi:sulfite reductase (NADPH) hemoprotein beta-component